MKANKHDYSELDVQSAPRLLHIILLSGIALAVVILAIGLVSFLIDSDLDIEESMAIESLFNGITVLSSEGLLGIGIFVIVSTPLVRIVATAVIFKREGDRLMILLSIVVLAIITAGFLLGIV